MDINTLQALAENIKFLMKKRGWSQEKLAKKAGVSQRTVSNLLNPGSIDSPTIASAEKIADAFGLQFWHICIPKLEKELLDNKSLERLIECYSGSNEYGRENTLRIAESEMRYNKISNQPK